MRRNLLGFFVLLHCPVWAVPEPLPSLAEPALSPDNSEIAFVSGGDIWSVGAEGGKAHLLVTHAAAESRPVFSPDGSKLAFVSTRTGHGDVYVLTLASGQIQRLTFADVSETLDGWSRDGQWIYFTSSVNDVAGQGDVFRVRATGGTPLEVSRERFLNEFEGAPSPDGRALALIAKGMSRSQWWRHGHSHIDESELWLESLQGRPSYRKLSSVAAKYAWPMWEPDGRSLCYMSDQGGAENLWRMPVSGGQPQPLTHFRDGRLLWPSISYDGKTIVFERDFRIWKADTRTGQAAPLSIQLRGSSAGPGVKHLVETRLRRLALSPDGKKVAVVARGQVFAASAKEGGEAQRVSWTVSAEGEPCWSPDSSRLLYVSQRNGHQQIFEYDFHGHQEKLLATPAGDAQCPRYSPDGKSVAYVLSEKEVHVLTAGQDRVLAHGNLEEPRLVWSPDGRWLVYASVDAKSFRNLHAVPSVGGPSLPISFLAHGESADSVAWSPDGKFILFETTQRSESYRMARVDLVPHLPRYREDQFRELFHTPKGSADAEAGAPEPSPSPKVEAKKASAPVHVHIVTEGIRERLSLLPLGVSATHPVISPDGKTLLFTARSGNQSNLYTWSLDELAREAPVARQLTSTAGEKADAAFSPDGKEVYYLEGGALRSVPLESRVPKAVALTATLDVDFDKEKLAVFEEAWGLLNRRFYDEHFHGHDWRALRERWLPYIAGCRVPEELARDLNLLIGELNASHCGYSPAPMGSIAAVPVGNLGLRFDREAYEAGRGLVVRELLSRGPCATSVHVGDKLLAVNGREIGPHTNLDEVLSGQVGRRVELRLSSGTAVVKPVDTSTAAGLLYRQWVESRRALVDKLSGGRLGYVHIADMTENSLNQLYLDLDAPNQAKRGVVVDIRHNNGGFVNGFALDVFARKNYLMMTNRGRTPVPSRQNLGQRALGLPTVLLTNESSLSDAEDFTEGYRTLKLGKVVGVPTAGWIIFTSGYRLVDDSSVRIPFMRVQDLRGQNMELNPRPVDIRVERPLGESLEGRDAQLERAVRVLLDDLH